MTPARSLAASVVALGFASTLTAPSPALGAPAPCERAENYAAQSGAELLRIDRLQVRRPPGTGGPNSRDGAGATPQRRTITPDDTASSGGPDGATDRILGTERDTARTNDDSLSRGVGTSEGVGTLTETALDEFDDDTPTTDDPAPSTGDAAPTTDDGANTGGVGGGTALPAAPKPGGDPRGQTATVSGVGLGDTRTAMVATASIKSAAMARVLDGQTDEHASLTEPVLQQAPPGNDAAATRETPARRVGPLGVGSGTVLAHARWDAGMACANTTGEVARSRSDLASAAIWGGGSGPLIRIPGKVSSLSTTALERRGGSARTVASATVAAGRIEMARGKVRLRVLRSPTLVASMAADGNCEIRYQPAVVEVSGDGIDTTRLSAAGDDVDIAIDPEKRPVESVTDALDGVRAGSPLPLPAVPGLPSVDTPRTESASAAGPGTRLRISLGEVRQAKRGQAVAARATAIQVTITEGAPAGGRTKPGYDTTARPAVSLDLDFGLLEAAAVAPEAGRAASAGVGGGLPVTGPSGAKLAAIGAGLLMVGAGVLLLGPRRWRVHP